MFDLGASESQVVRSLMEKYPASFSGAEVSVFGIVGAGDKEPPLEAKERIFSAFFLNSWARLRSFSSSLPQQRNDLFPQVTRMDGVFEGGGARGSAKLVLIPSKGASVADGWLAFAVGRTPVFVPFQGDYQCNTNECKLTATCTESIPALSMSPYFRKDDRLVLTGKNEAALEGTLQADAREVFREGNQEVKYNLKFSKR
jgi:hypothetical protein